MRVLYRSAGTPSDSPALRPMTSTTPTPMLLASKLKQGNGRDDIASYLTPSLSEPGVCPTQAWHAKPEAATFALINWYERSNAPGSPARTGEAGRELKPSSASRNYAPGVHAILKRFLAFEDRIGAEMLLEATEHRRYGTRTMEFNCFDVEIDADAESVTIVEIVADNGARAVIPVEELLRDLRDLPA
jgi:hypothetical protein